MTSTISLVCCCLMQSQHKSESSPGFPQLALLIWWRRPSVNQTMSIVPQQFALYYFMTLKLGPWKEKAAGYWSVFKALLLSSGTTKSSVVRMGIGYLVKVTNQLKTYWFFDWSGWNMSHVPPTLIINVNRPKSKLTRTKHNVSLSSNWLLNQAVLVVGGKYLIVIIMITVPIVRDIKWYISDSFTFFFF